MKNLSHTGMLGSGPCSVGALLFLALLLGGVAK